MASGGGGQLRREVLRCYKQLMRTKETVFVNDIEAQCLVRTKAREEFDKNRNLTEEDEIKESIKVGHDSIEILKRTVLQGRLNDRGNYEIKINKENLDGGSMLNKNNINKNKKTTKKKENNN